MRFIRITRRLAPLFLLLALSTSLSAQVQDHRKIKYPPLRPVTLPAPEQLTLANGMVILLVEDHELPVIEGYALVRAGARLVPSDKTGLASIFAEVLRTGGSGDKSGDDIDEFLEARGATLEANLSDNYGLAYLWCLKENFGEVVSLLSDMLRKPRFAPEKIEVVKNQILAGVARRNDDPNDIMFREHTKLVYGADSPYAQVPEFSTVASVTRDDLISFHKTYFHPDRIVFGLVGDFDKRKMKKTLKQVFSGWAEGQPTRDAEATFQKSTRPGIYFVPKEDTRQSHIILGHLGIRKDNPDRFAVEVLNEVLGGTFTSRLFVTIRSRRGLAYSVTGSIDSEYDFPGIFSAWMTTKTETTAAGLEALLGEIDRIVAEPPTEQEVALAKESILNSFIFNFDSPGKVLRQQLVYKFFGYPPDYLSHYRDQIEKVTVKEVARVAKKYIQRKQLVILVVGPSQGQDRPLNTFGEVTTLDITIPPPSAATGQETPKRYENARE